MLGNVRSWNIPEYFSLARPRNTCHLTKRYVEGGIGYPVGPRMSGTDSALNAPLRRCIHPSVFYVFYSFGEDWRHQLVAVEVLTSDVCQPAIPSTSVSLSKSEESYIQTTLRERFSDEWEYEIECPHGR